MGHKETIESIEAWPTSPSTGRNTLDALVAVYRLLDERLPEKPMQVIATPDVPQDTSNDGVLDFVGNCRERHGDQMTASQQSNGIYFSIRDKDKISEVVLSKADAERLARAILASI